MDRVRTDTFAILQAEWDQHWVDFLKGELALGFTFSALAATSYGSGNRTQAEQSVARAKEAYATLARYLSDPERFNSISGPKIRTGLRFSGHRAPRQDRCTSHFRTDDIQEALRSDVSAGAERGRCDLSKASV